MILLHIHCTVDPPKCLNPSFCRVRCPESPVCLFPIDSLRHAAGDAHERPEDERYDDDRDDPIGVEGVTPGVWGEVWEVRGGEGRDGDGIGG